MGRLKKRFDEPICSISSFLPDDFDDDFIQPENNKDNDMSSEADELKISKRSKVLDDALFQFFKKEAVKTLKRKFSALCRATSLKNEIKGFKRGAVDRCAFTRFSLKYFSDVLKYLTPYQRSVIERFGFGCLLKFEKCEVPSKFVRWIACHVDSRTSEILFDGKIIPVKKQSIHYVLGLPIGGDEIILDSEAGMSFILSLFQLDSMPVITYFGNKLKGLEDLSDEEIFVCFMVVALSCFLCPSSSMCPCSKYLAVLQHPEKVKDFDFCKLVYDWLLLSISEFNNTGKITGRRSICNYFLSVYYLDFLDFGAQTIEQTIPRIVVWKGNMIKVFAELDEQNMYDFGRRPIRRYRKNSCDFGRRPIKHLSATCYQEIFVCPEKGAPSNICGHKGLPLSFRHKIHFRFGHDLRPEFIDGIIAIVENISSSKKSEMDDNSELLVTNILLFLSQVRSMLNFDGSKTIDPTLGGCNGPTPHGDAEHKSAAKRANSNDNFLKNNHEEHDVHGEHSITPQNYDTHQGDTNVDKSEACAHNTISTLKAPYNNESSHLQQSNHSKGSKMNRSEACNFSSNPKCAPLERTVAVSQQPTAVESQNLEGNNHPVDLALNNLSMPVTPECAITKVVESTSIRTVQVPDLCQKKVMSRFCHFKSEEGELDFVDANGPLFTNLDPEIEKVYVLDRQAKIQSDLQDAHNENYFQQAKGSVETYCPSCQPNNSPDVQIVGARDFNVRCTQLSEETDVAYNKMMYPENPQVKCGQSNVTPLATTKCHPLSSSTVKEPVQGKGMFNDPVKNANVHSVLQNERFPVSDVDVRNYMAIIKLGQSTTYQKEEAIKYNAVHCSYQSLGESLQPDGHVDNFLIPCYCRKLFEDRHPTISGKHYFFSYVGEKILDFHNSDNGT